MKEYKIINLELEDDGLNDILETTLIKITMQNKEETISKVFEIDDITSCLHVEDYIYYDGENIILEA